MPDSAFTMEFAEVMGLFNEAYERLWFIVLTMLLIGFVLSRWKAKSWQESPLAKWRLPSVIPTPSEKAIWLMIHGIALALRLPLLVRSLWYDEAFTAAMANTPTLSDFGKALISDVHPPLHYLITKIFVAAFGQSEIVLRLPSLIAGLLIIYMVFRMTLSLLPHIEERRIIAFYASVLVAILPAMSYYSVEARYPMLLALAVCTALWALFEQRVKLLTVALLCIPLLHAVGIIYAGVLLILSAYQLRSRAAKVILLTTPSVIAAGLLILIQSSDVANGFWLPPVNPTWHIIDMTVMLKVSDGALALVIMLTIMFVTALSIWVARGLLTRSWRGQFVAVIALVPVALWAVGEVWHPIYLQRAVLASTIMIVVIWSYAMTRLHWSITLLFWLVLNLSIIAAQHDYLIEKQVTIRDVFDYCDGVDYVYATTTHMGINALYYAPAPLKAWRNGDSLAQELSNEAKQSLGLQLVQGYNDLPSGEWCLVAMYEANTRDAEIRHINHIVKNNRVSRDEWINVSPLMSYRIVRFFHD